ncbi:MAG: cytochrome b5 domain-containing protein [Patescibacteria group bacterium]
MLKYLIGFILILGFGYWAYTSYLSPILNRPTDTGKSYTTAEIAKNNTKENCWVSYNGNVYDATLAIKNNETAATFSGLLCGKVLDEGITKFALEQAKTQGFDISIIEKLKIGTLAK